jgi:hypothetical protein
MFPKNDDNNITTESMLNEIRELYKEKRTFYQSYQNNLHRNILLIGRRNIGKTTLKNILQDPCYVSDEATLISRTPSIILHPSFSLSGSNLSLTIIETSRSFELNNNNEHLSKINTFCITNNLTEFHLICFCTSFESGIQNEDIDSLHKLIKHFGQQICSCLCLIITRCELKTNQQRNHLLNELRHDVGFKKVIPYFQQGIYFTGSTTQDCYRRKDRELLIDQFETVYTYRENLLKLIGNTTNSFFIQPKIEQPMSAAQSQQNYSTLQTNSQSHDHIHERGCCKLL